ncbi:unnamed protein product [Allacma fusca]|uniref:Neurotransmitter-gated ion-channel transmembrane domain-containing protein n=1 Tax=Allacma fusca TaxID=39272 RepID=A0A8J2Q472_9HEXA|nr:unnamed protein product [Allacma fusca]
MDTQVCQLAIGSYIYASNDLEYFWDKNAPYPQNSNQISNLPFFKISELRQVNESLHFGELNYSLLRMEIILSRTFGYYFFQVYFPISMLVALSWVPFWINYRAVVERISVGVTIILTTSTAIASSRENFPKSAYLKAIDVYSGICIFFVFASILENVLVIYFLKKIEFGVKNNTQPELSSNEKSEKRFSTSEDRAMEFKLSSDAQAGSHFHPQDVDKLARIAFPMTFLTFNVVYFGYCLIASAQDFNEKISW